MLKSIAEQLEQDVGPKPVDHARPRNGVPASFTDSVFQLARSVKTLEVLDRLGIVHEETNRGHMATCPGCGEEGALVCKDGGIKCLHDRCAHAGPRNNQGFRSNVDLVMHVKQVDKFEAARTICEWAGIKVPAQTPRENAPPPGRFDDEAPNTEPRPDPFAGHFKFLDDELLLTSPPQRKYLLKRDGVGVLPLGKAAMLIGAGGVGKTLFECQLALSVALGRDFLGTFSIAAPGPVFLALAEEELEEVQRRLHSAAASLGLSNEERVTATRRIVALPMAGTNVALTSGDGKGNVEVTPNRDWLFKHLEELAIEWRLIILDPLSRWAGNDVEKDSHAATRFVEVVEGLAKVRGNPTVLVAHHSSKAARRADGPMAGSEASRGASALTDGVRWVANLDSDGSHVVVMRVTKNNYAPPVDPVYLLRDSDNGGALRPMSSVELEDFESEREQSKGGRGGRAPVLDPEIEARITEVVSKHGVQPSVRALKRLGVRGEDKRIRRLAQNLGAINR